jgi:hypothetical protein
LAGGGGDYTLIEEETEVQEKSWMDGGRIVLQAGGERAGWYLLRVSKIIRIAAGGFLEEGEMNQRNDEEWAPSMKKC